MQLVEGCAIGRSIKPVNSLLECCIGLYSRESRVVQPAKGWAGGSCTDRDSSRALTIMQASSCMTHTHTHTHRPNTGQDTRSGVVADWRIGVPLHARKGARTHQYFSKARHHLAKHLAALPSQRVCCVQHKCVLSSNNLCVTQRAQMQ
jgi:hypothetical protein